MLTIWCVFVGNKYPVEYVYNMKNMVANNITQPYQFKCISDRPIPHVETLPAFNYFSAVSEKLWWHKLALFHYADGPSIYFDLDTIITGLIDNLVPYTVHKLSMPANWSMSGHGGWQSSCMAWDGSLKKPFDDFRYECIGKYWGDQEFISDIIDNIKPIPPNLVLSYKYHIQREGLKKPPKDSVAITFHGKPDYDEVTDPWIKSAFTPVPV